VIVFPLVLFLHNNCRKVRTMRTTFRWLVAALLCIAIVGGLWIAAPPKSSQAQSTVWTASVFNTVDLTGAPVWTGSTTSINYTWGLGAPVINGTTTTSQVDGFSVRFVTSTFFTAGTYRFTVQVDDGARLFVDGAAVINAWTGGSFRTVTGDYAFATDGNHTVTVEMFDVTVEAAIIAYWSVISGSTTTTTPVYSGIPWVAEFFVGADLAGAPVFTTSYPPSGLNLQWGAGSPGGAVPVDNFSGRFTRSLTVPNDIPKGIYTFYFQIDDAYRFYVDSALIIDHWTAYEAGVQTSIVTLLEGPHTFRLEYREFSVNAMIFLTWAPPNAQNPVLPAPGTPCYGCTPTTTGGTPVPTGVTGTVNGGVVNVRSMPDTNASVVTQIRRGEIYNVTGRNAEATWAQITVGSQSGWVMAQYLTFTGTFANVPVVTPTAPTAPVVQPATGIKGMVLGNLRLRQGPSTRTTRLGVMPWGAQVDILGRDQTNTWYQVVYNGTTGWAYASWVRITQGDGSTLPYTDGTTPISAPPVPTQGVIAQAFGNMRIRSGPGFQFPMVGKAVWGTRVQVIGRSENGRWLKIQLGAVTGWSYATWYRTVEGDINTVPIVNQ
jgi:uncharacterized protein YraI